MISEVARGEVVEAVEHDVRDSSELPSYPRLHDLMRRYQLEDLVDISPEAFRTQIEQFLALRDPVMEGFSDPLRQERLAVEFHWGHTHDFGSFQLQGRMGKHHMSMMAVFLDVLEALPHSLTGVRVLDVGCWTGGTSLLLCAMGAEVVAVEEIRKYARCAEFLGRAFGVDRLDVKSMSLFECTSPEFQDAFDIVLCAGVLHHLSDPKLALRIIFNCLKNGGRCLLETVAHDQESLVNLVHTSPEATDPDSPRSSGWNGLLFTPEKLSALLAEVGFDEPDLPRAIRYKTPEARLFTVARRSRHVDFRRAGLSRAAVR